MLSSRNYSTARFWGDLTGGLTTGIVALPLALAFGVASGLGPAAGLWGAILVGFFAAVFGGTPSQVSGPTGPMTVVMTLVITRFAHDPALAFTVVMLGGLLQIGLGALRLGTYINLVPYPVISGFMTGIGVIIIILQLAPLFGHVTPDGGTLVALGRFPEAFSDPNRSALFIGCLTLALVVWYPRPLRRYFPAPLCALIAGTLLAVVALPDVPTIGAIPVGLPDPVLPHMTLHDFPQILRSAIVLAFLGSIDSLLTSLVADSATRSFHNSNRELIGQGIGNMAAGLFSALPGAGATMRTLVNIRAGGTTRVSGATHALVLLAVVLGFGRFAAHVPLAVLAGILTKVGIDIIDWRYLRRIRHAPRAGVVIMLTVAVLTVIADLITAIAVGVVMASLLFVKRMADSQMASMTLAKGRKGFTELDLDDEERRLLEAAGDSVYLFHVNGPLSFGCARGLTRLLTEHRSHDVLIIDLSDVPFIDSSATFAIEEVVEAALRDKDQVILCGLNERVTSSLARLAVLRRIPDDQIVATRREALVKAAELMKSL